MMTARIVRSPIATLFLFLCWLLFAEFLTDNMGVVFMSKPVWGIERDDVYRFLGEYRVVASSGVRLYFPSSSEAVMPRVLQSLISVRHRVGKGFPGMRGFEAVVLLTDHDDRSGSMVDHRFNVITLGLFDETHALTTRGYSLEKRFAISLSHILLARTLGFAHTAWRRRLVRFAVPTWFLEGLALAHAFPPDALHVGRLLDMARHNRIHSLDDLERIKNAPMLVREEMKVQAHSMIVEWEKRAGPGSGLNVLKRLRRNPIGFDEVFQEVFGISLHDAFREYKTSLLEHCFKLECHALAPPEILSHTGHRVFCQGFRALPDGRQVWVSSKRYALEVYDLYERQPDGRVRIRLKNVHPALYVDREGTIFLGRYQVNRKRQQRLSLWAVPPTGRPRRLASGPGSFKPLGLRGGRLLYLEVRSGMTRVFSIDPSNPDTPRKELDFGPADWPLEVAYDPHRDEFFTLLNRQGILYIVRTSALDPKSPQRPFYASDGRIRNLMIADGKLWFARESDFRTLQVLALPLDQTPTPVPTQYSSLPGGVWDFQPGIDHITASTLWQGGFRVIRLPISLATSKKGPASIELSPTDDDVPGCRSDGERFPGFSPDGFPPLPEFPWKTYCPEIRNSYWLPQVSRDDQGHVFGIYSYHADRLDRQRFILSPTYGIRSNHVGYRAEVMRRFDLWRIDLKQRDLVAPKSYMSNAYYERIRSTELRFMYPMSLSTTVSFGTNIAHRNIAKYPKRGLTPTAGRDHTLFGEVLVRAIRIEPYWDMFPRRGRTIRAYYRRGLNWLNGEMRYESFGLRWNEYRPLGDDWVLTGRLYVAEDDKEGGIRRPDELSLGGSNFLRGDPASHRHGDSLRAFGVSLGHPIDLKMPVMRGLIHKERIIGELFWERGDVRQAGETLDVRENYGVEIRARGLVFRRISVDLRCGIGWPRYGGPKHTYWGVEFSNLVRIIL